jgi:hypothetical protein
MRESTVWTLFVREPGLTICFSKGRSSQMTILLATEENEVSCDCCTALESMREAVDKYIFWQPRRNQLIPRMPVPGLVLSHSKVSQRHGCQPNGHYAEDSMNVLNSRRPRRSGPRCGAGPWFDRAEKPSRNYSNGSSVAPASDGVGSEPETRFALSLAVASARRGESWYLEVDPFQGEVVATGTFARSKAEIAVKRAIAVSVTK